MEIDYSPFLHVLQNGTIWWPLTDAVKLGAGYLPMRDDEHNLDPVLRAKNNQVLANERTLFSEFSQDHYTEAHPRFLVRDDCRYVEAHEFLTWLTRYVAEQTQPDIVFPNDLDRAVNKATGAAVAHSMAPPVFESLTLALEGWFDRPLAELPDALRQRAEQDLSPMPWDNLTAEGRRSVALQLDYQHDPATEQDRKLWWDFFQRTDTLKEQIKEWEAIATPTAGDLALRENRLTELRQELARMEGQKRQARGDYYPERRRLDGESEASAPSPCAPVQYVAYPKVMHQLAQRLGATPEELAAWVYAGPKDGGITAYLNANELDPPPRFHYTTGSDNQDYVAPLMACWFRADEIDQFEPAERYITGHALIARWGKHPGLHAVAFIHAKIAESRLLDIHPIYGGTQGTFSEHADFPLLTTGLFVLSHVEKIEVEDFAADVERGEPSTTNGQPTSVDGARVPSSTSNGAPVGPCAVFLAMENLVASELSLAFVGDKGESGLGANNMLEISARGTTKRVALAALDLVDRRRGTLDSQGVILLGMAQRQKLPRTDKNAKKMTRLREVLRRHFGVVGDPFEQFRKNAGWVPHFKISDNRGLADDRAKQDAERLTVSYDQLTESGAQFADADRGNSFSDGDDDAAAEWLKDNDPDARA